MENDVKELLKMLYETNERHHDSKERLVWLASTLYFSFVVYTFVQAPPVFKSITPENRLVLMASFISVCGFALFFVVMQNWWKCLSVEKTGKLNKLIKEMTNQLTYHDLIEMVAHVKEKKFRKTVCHFWRDGKSGVIILFAMIVFCIFQMIYIF